jgi:hypothetical protein
MAEYKILKYAVVDCPPGLHVSFTPRDGYSEESDDMRFLANTWLSGITSK